LFLFGTVTMDFPVVKEFHHYDSGVFHPYPEDGIDERVQYGHSVRVIGWGRESGREYWLAVNTYGTEWGGQGLFRFDTGPLLAYGFKLEVHAGMPRISPSP